MIQYFLLNFNYALCFCFTECWSTMKTEPLTLCSVVSRCISGPRACLLHDLNHWSILLPPISNSYQEDSFKCMILLMTHKHCRVILSTFEGCWININGTHYGGGGNEAQIYWMTWLENYHKLEGHWYSSLFFLHNIKISEWNIKPGFQCFHCNLLVLTKLVTFGRFWFGLIIFFCFIFLISTCTWETRHLYNDSKTALLQHLIKSSLESFPLISQSW